MGLEAGEAIHCFLNADCFGVRTWTADKRTVGDAFAELEGDDGFVDAVGGVSADSEDDWVDPVPPPPVMPTASKKAPSKGKGTSKSKKAVPVPVPNMHYRFLMSAEDTGSTGVSTSPQHERQRITTISPRAAGASAGRGGHGFILRGRAMGANTERELARDPH
jgi:hypothetical protein